VRGVAVATGELVSVDERMLVRYGDDEEVTDEGLMVG
jgi:hypothetical protein